MRARASLSDWAPIAGAAGSLIGLVTALVLTYQVDTDIVIALASATVAFAAGAMGKSIAARASRLARDRRVFLSYAHEDRELADQIASALREAGVRVWLDREQIKVGEDISAAVARGMEHSDAFLPILTRHPSRNLEYELALARQRGVRLIPVVASEAELPTDLAGLRYVDMRRDRAKALAEIVEVSTGGAG